MKIEVGQIFRVSTKFTGTLNHRIAELRNEVHKVEVSLKEGEYIEIRYPFEWHFRTADNIYLHASAYDILTNCQFIGTIHKDVRFSNDKDLRSILDEGLFDYFFEELND